ncbi:MAG: diguanylate cyclase [Rhodocyclaceae bacterium]|jgi:diguanylate cyclase (GGDEF)-like protein/PAS domain S-box-containing protein|nr:diguanylate cyclase [Rhodocyclaceae bacterium]
MTSPLGFPPASDSPSEIEGFSLKRYRTILVSLYAVSALFFLGLGIYERQRIEESIDAIALERGRVLFGLIELTRDWNTRHGGIYVPVTEATQPNPYLEHPRRDVETSDGQRLTMVNPAFMTRQIAELAERMTGVRFHITSLKPIRPANEADEWEAKSLHMFESAMLKERVEYFDSYAFGGQETRPAHRYMAPLLVKKPCLTCHEKQGYRVGDIRGGISVTMPAEDLMAVRDQRVRGSMLIVLASFIVTSALLHLLAGRARTYYLQLQKLAKAQEGVIAERTRELEERNDDLRREIVERRRNEHELRLAGAVFESAAEAIMVTDVDNNIVRVNPAFTAITGYTPKEVMGRKPSLLKSGRHDAAFYESMWQALETLGHWEGEIWNRRKNGDIFVEWLSISSIESGDDGSGRYLAVFHDITRRKEAEDALRHRAQHDPLTDLPNRALFRDRLEAALSQTRRYRRNFALMMVDLDRFKEVNDSLGHAAGDELLIEAARRLSSCVRESDTVARLGGDEFAMILTELENEKEAEQVARRAVALLAEPYYLDAGTAHISGCIGIALCPQHGLDSEHLQRNADSALYKAKEGGRNDYRIHAGMPRGEPPQGDLL